MATDGEPKIGRGGAVFECDLLSSGRLSVLFESFLDFDRVGLAVSGGVDSIGLVRLAAQWRHLRLCAGATAPELVVLSVDHGLRPEAGGEAKQVAMWADDMGLAHDVLVWQPGTAVRSGVQAAAREGRYGLLVRWAAGQQGRTAIATAHHVSDQAETVLMRLARGSGVDGLGGMRSRTSREGVAILRPLLEVGKDELIAVCQTLGAAWLDDPSNEQPAFERVRLRRARSSRDRLGLTDQALSRSARRLARASEGLEFATDLFLERALRGQPYLALGSFVWHPMEEQWPPEIEIRALARVLSVFGGDARVLRDLGGLEGLHHQLVSPAFGGATLGGCQVSSTSAGILIHRETGRASLPEISLRAGATAIWDQRFSIVLKGHPDQGAFLPDVVIRPADPNLASDAKSGARWGASDMVDPIVRMLLPGVPAAWHGSVPIPVQHIGWRIPLANGGNVTHEHGATAPGPDPVACQARFLVERLFSVHSRSRNGL